MKIPEVIIYNTMNMFLALISKNYEESSNKDDSIIAQLFKEDDNKMRILLNDYDYYKQAIAILNRKSSDTRKLELNIGYNMERISMPTVHILMPNDSKGRIDTIGHSEEKTFEGENENMKMYLNKTRSNSSTYYLMITSDNSSEVMIIYYFLKAMFLLFHEELEHMGLLNLSNQGQDLSIQQEYAPNNIFHRNLALSFDYEFSVKMNIPMPQMKGFTFGPCEDLSEDWKQYMSNLQM